MISGKLSTSFSSNVTRDTTVGDEICKELDISKEDGPSEGVYTKKRKSKLIMRNILPEKTNFCDVLFMEVDEEEEDEDEKEVLAITNDIYERVVAQAAMHQCVHTYVKESRPKYVVIEDVQSSEGPEVCEVLERHGPLRRVYTNKRKAVTERQGPSQCVYTSVCVPSEHMLTEDIKQEINLNTEQVVETDFVIKQEVNLNTGTEQVVETDFVVKQEINLNTEQVVETDFVIRQEISLNTEQVVETDFVSETTESETLQENHSSNVTANATVDSKNCEELHLSKECTLSQHVHMDRRKSKHVLRNTLTEDIKQEINLHTEQLVETDLVFETTESETLPESRSSNVTDNTTVNSKNCEELNLSKESTLSQHIRMDRRKSKHVLREDTPDVNELSQYVSAVLEQTKSVSAIKSSNVQETIGEKEQQKTKRQKAMQHRRVEVESEEELPQVSAELGCVCESCGKVYRRQVNLDKHLLWHKEECRFKCSKCICAFNTEFHLKRHMLRHKGSNSNHLKKESALQCSVCKKLFSKKVALSSHMRTHEEKPLPQCQICEKTFANRRKLSRHMDVHSTNRPFKCDLCSKTYKSKVNLTYHMLRHRNEKPNQCHVCGKGFTSGAGLKSHMQTHSRARPFQCTLPNCGMTYRHSSAYLLHMRRHTGVKPFKCNECDASFLEKSHLERHIRTHTGERPYVCFVCKNAFRRQHHLQKHMLSHTGERLFTCDVCQLAFTYKYALKTHIRKEHKC